MVAERIEMKARTRENVESEVSILLSRITDLQEVHKKQELIQTGEAFLRNDKDEIREIYDDALKYYDHTKGSSFPWTLKRPKNESKEVKNLVNKYYLGVEKTGFPMGDAEDPVLALFEIAFNNVSALSNLKS